MTHHLRSFNTVVLKTCKDGLNRKPIVIMILDSMLRDYIYFATLLYFMTFGEIKKTLKTLSIHGHTSED